MDKRQQDEIDELILSARDRARGTERKFWQGSFLIPRVVMFSIILPCLVVYGTAAWYLAEQHAELGQLIAQVTSNKVLSEANSTQLKQIDVRLIRMETQIELLLQQKRN